jgi:hypothetical protein
MMYVMINNYSEITAYSLVDSRENLIETFLFTSAVEEYLPWR